MTTSWLLLRPRDTIAVRDGRPFDAGTGATAAAVFPWPSTVAGAVGSIYGREVRSVRGPVLTNCHDRDHGTEFELLFPAPADLYAPSGATTVQRLLVRRLEAGVVTDLDGHGIRHFPSANDEQEPVTAWIRGDALERYLARATRYDSFDLRHDFEHRGRPEDADLVISDELHVGLTLTSQRAAEQGLLYAAHHMRFQDRLGILVSVDDDQPLEVLPTHVKLGGEGRLADVEIADGVALPNAPEHFPDGKVLLYLATPGIWADGWRPDLPADATLVTAALKEPVPVPTASPRLRAQPGGFLGTARLRWAVPAGSVYYIKFGTPDAARDWVHGTSQTPAAHGRPLTAAEPRLATAGFGIVLAGSWAEPEENDD